MSEIAATYGWDLSATPAPDDFPPPAPDDLELAPPEQAEDYGLIEYERMSGGDADERGDPAGDGVPGGERDTAAGTG